MRYWMAYLPWLVLSACLEPVVADFKNEAEVLTEDEFLWDIRIPRTTNMYGLEGITSADSIAAITYSVPIFEQVLPLLLADLKTGKIKSFGHEYDQREEVAVADLTRKLTNWNLDWRDISPLLQVFHVAERVLGRKGDFSAVGTHLVILWVDPEGKRPEHYFARVRVADLDYQINIAGVRMTFHDYLQARQYYFFPINVSTRERYLGLRTMEEAYFLKEKVMTGNWASVTFLDGFINLSEKTPVTLESAQIDAVAGLYTFDPVDFPEAENGAADSIQLYLAVKQDRLEAEWSWKGGEKEELYAENAQSFFNVNGDSYEFVQEGDPWQVVVKLYGAGGNQVRIGHKQ